ncbi:undecaprenyldiphospho-muramoylpentapeptide beta-N-acetylglucosaminyltransferase [Desulfurivibrio alkaliphilus]|uniref:UDP-N-acetylglucosamine--N-acetylmuramyl-(pentapeptide) pyrophosphoryl-undecaprenol N-acetylglucosamine transferase n=1 Tax=Desulfurivibrio alkaliphilus (strain DSM 19089 / UNIQEM U267 / AHT2) TaxID=589865 RepID=D6Z3Q1_DESAT|nr:undecaprenyldiphospho-muramoylpentapeptide beta-N-acetylglucosaminyltransferase [Desulfurivibrio alkaliphilus]ADH86176.1 UDP-N-acetylglucosamine--N-acetylmuramyl-(pentapeptide) pyrophosphoryl-undecaprenol N-acetylglucosamine transferase [Desulfurivibrio alkaliphilus AHT 2]
MRAFRLVITGGGTGGHLFPGIAVADELLARYPGSEVLFIGTGRDIERRALTGKPYRQATLTGSGLKGISWPGRLASLARIPVGFWQALGLLREFKPHLVLGVGGYVTGPVLLAARMLRVPACIHEQNSVPGLTNRLLGRFVHRVFLALPDQRGHFPAARASLVGNPLRRELLAAAESAGDAGGGREDQRPRLLVLGGSLGAHRVNLLMVEAATLLAAQGIHPAIRHQTGRQDRAMVAERYRQAGIEAQVEDFVDDMAAAYLAADLVVSRAGATTLAELALFGKASLLIPYPYAADDHQRLNAEIMVGQGAARLRLEKDLSPRELAGQIRELLADSTLREEMARQARALARPQAAAEIIAQGLALGGVKSVS